MRLRIEKLVPNDFKTLISWIDSKETLFQFAGSQFTYPLTVYQLEKYIEFPQKRVVKFLNERGEMIGHGEFNFEREECPRLSRIIVNPKQIGKGYGEEIVQIMAGELFANSTIMYIDLCVFEWNKPAIRCYEKVGFTIHSENTTIFKNDNITWTRLNMLLYRDNYTK